MFIFLIYTAILINNNEIYKIDMTELSFNTLTLNEEVIDYKINDLLYVLTTRNIYSIDTINLQILDRTLLPQKFNYLNIGKDEIFLIATSEIIILNRANLAFKTGIGIEPKDYEPMTESAHLPKNLLYLVVHDEKKSVIKIIDCLKGRIIRNAPFARIKNFYYIPAEKQFVILTASGLHYLDLNLKIKKSIKFKFPGENFFFDKDGYIITNPQAICLIDFSGGIIDFQPLIFNNGLLHRDFVFWNNDFIVLIDPLTLRIGCLLKNNNNIKDVYPIDYEQSICINKNNELFVIDNRIGAFKNLTKKAYALVKVLENQAISQDSLFYLQFGAFSDKEYARYFCDSLNKRGLPVFIDTGDDHLFRIKLGGFMEKTLAQEIVENSGVAGWIVYHKKIESDVDSIFSFNQNDYYLKQGIITKKE